MLAYAGTWWVELDGTSRKWPCRVGSGTDRVRRAQVYLTGAPARWAPFRGVVVADRLRAVGGLRAGLGYEADGRMLFRLLLDGPFVRVPDVLVEKRVRPTSVSSARRAERFRIRLDYGPEILAADLGPTEPAHLLGLLGCELARLSWRRARFHLRPLTSTLRRWVPDHPR